MASALPLHISLRNNTQSRHVHAYITALDAQSHARFFVRANRSSLYYPATPSHDGAPLLEDVAIDLGPPGHSTDVEVPTYFVGGRIYFVIEQLLTFRLNRGQNGNLGLVEPSVANPADPNIHKLWDFCELSFNPTQVFANITYVDFVCVPASLTLYTSDNQPPQHVAGMDSKGLEKVANGLREQSSQDGIGWNRLIESNQQGTLRILSPNTAISRNGSLFGSYFAQYVARVWEYYRNHKITINTQAQWGNVSGRVVNGVLRIGGTSFVKPMTRDIFSCSTGAFLTGSNPERNAIIPRLAAAFNRTVMLEDDIHPNGDKVDTFYKHNPTNHYSRIVHEANLDKKGYAFPYDDVTSSQGKNQAGVVYGPPRTLIVAIGGNKASLQPAPLNAP